MGGDRVDPRLLDHSHIDNLLKESSGSESLVLSTSIGWRTCTNTLIYGIDDDCWWGRIHLEVPLDADHLTHARR